MLDRMITENVEDSSLYTPFKEDLDNLTSLSQHERYIIIYSNYSKYFYLAIL